MSAEGGSDGLVAAGAGESDPDVLWAPSLLESKEGTDGGYPTLRFDVCGSESEFDGSS